MINILKRYYDIEIKEYDKYKDGIVFFINDSYYYFMKYEFDIEYLTISYDFYVYLKSKKIKIHDFVFNKNKELISESYILFKLNCFLEDIDINDILLFSKNIITKEFMTYNMIDFWYRKIDYLEKQVTELSDNKLINYSFDYFIGISEELLLYFKNNYFNDENNICLVHRSLDSLSSIDFYNPLNIMVDSKYKDIISYIRLTDDWNLFLNLLDRINSNDKIYIFVRMCFPFKYFNLVSDIILNNKSNNELAIVLNRITEYEEYLKMVEKMCGIYLFSWIKKE